MKNTQKHFQNIAAIAFFASFPLLGGCFSSTLNVKDNSASIPSFKSSFGINDKLSVEIDIAKTEGDGNYFLPNGEEIDIDATSITGPATLQNYFELQTAFAGVGIKLLDKSRISLNLLAGIRNVSMDLSINPGATPNQFEASSVGPSARFEAVLPFSNGLGSIIHISHTFFESGDNGDFSDWGINLTYQFHNNAYLFAGWQNWGYRNTAHLSDIDLEASGASYGIKLTF